MSSGLVRVRLPGPFAGVALIDICHSHRLPGRGLDRVGQLADLIAILGIGWRDVQGQQPAGVSTT